MNDPDGINQRFFVDQLVEKHMSDLNVLYMDFHSRRKSSIVAVPVNKLIRMSPIDASHSGIEAKALFTSRNATRDKVALSPPDRMSMTISTTDKEMIVIFVLRVIV